MKMLFAFPALVAATGVVLTTAPRAEADGCGLTCHLEYRNCRIEAEPCGSNPDGTVIMCPVEICDIVEVCVPKPCTARPDPPRNERQAL